MSLCWHSGSPDALSHYFNKDVIFALHRFWFGDLKIEQAYIWLVNKYQSVLTNHIKKIGVGIFCQIWNPISFDYNLPNYFLDCVQ